MPSEPFDTYFDNLKEELDLGGVTEHSHRPALKERLHYMAIIGVPAETIGLMSEIDEAIPGWPIN